jgi:hypothetical protein
MRFDRLAASGGWMSAALGFALGLFAVGAPAATFDAKAGQIITKDVGGIKFHTYVTAGVSDHVIETPRSLILVDVSQVKDYNWVMAGHGVPMEGRAYFAKAIDYYTTLAKAIAETTDPAAAKARMKAAYPDYAGDALLDRMLAGFFKK